MFSDLASIRTALADDLSQLLPADWLIVHSMDDGAVNASVPVLYIEFKRLTGDANGQPLSRGEVACGIDLIVIEPGSVEGDVDAHVLKIAQALQRSSYIYWSSADKERFSPGEFGWRIQTLILCSTTPAPEV